LKDRIIIHLSITDAIKMELVSSQNLICFILDDGTVYVLFDELFPSLGQLATKTIISKSTIDRNLTKGMPSRLKHLLEIHDRLINTEKRNIRRVKITFSGFWSSECRYRQSLVTVNEYWYSFDIPLKHEAFIW
jgi:transcriptional antiterminator